MVTATAQRGGTYGAITPNPRTISGKTGTVKVLYMTGRTYITMYIMWDGSGFPTDLIVSFATTAEDSAGATNYIGVTPLKPYRITVDYGSEIDGTGGSAFIRYSQRINAVKPNLTDY